MQIKSGNFFNDEYVWIDLPYLDDYGVEIPGKTD